MKTILIFCAHSDDEAVGMGGTIQKLVEAGFEIIKIVFSYGEQSHPHFQKDIVIKKRKSETKKASEFLGISETKFLGLPDIKIKENLFSQNIKNQLSQLLNKYKPNKIYVPSAIDPHPDHRAVNNAILEIVDKSRKKYEVFEFEVWNVIKENKPTVYVDITPYYNKKVNYMKLFKSQWQYMYALWLPVYLRSKAYGRINHCRFAEKFYKVR
ncbi:MAG: PIG-L deacetylase family protein [Nanoarchaeota archaeon]|nr:PIG-L deacetylase family protein [Nanoarchaeota archaeon]